MTRGIDGKLFGTQFTQASIGIPTVHHIINLVFLIPFVRKGFIRVGGNILRYLRYFRVVAINHPFAVAVIGVGCRPRKHHLPFCLLEGSILYRCYRKWQERFDTGKSGVIFHSVARILVISMRELMIGLNVKLRSHPFADIAQAERIGAVRIIGGRIPVADSAVIRTVYPRADMGLPVGIAPAIKRIRDSDRSVRRNGIIAIPIDLTHLVWVITFDVSGITGS